MKLFKTTALTFGAGMMLAAAPAFAVVINNIDVPDSPGPHTLSGSVIENLALNEGEQLSGYGQVDAIDDSRPICGSGSCQLTYTFSGYTLQNITPTTADFTGGQVNFYTNEDGGYDTNDPSTASQGELFLSAVGAREPGSEFTLEGELTNSDLDQAQNIASGLLNVTGGAAASIFDNDSYQSESGTADLLFNTSLSRTGELTFSGSADAQYIRPEGPEGPNNVPEPSELAILSLGVVLIGLGMYRTRRRGDAV